MSSQGRRMTKRMGAQQAPRALRRLIIYILLFIFILLMKK